MSNFKVCLMCGSFKYVIICNKEQHFIYLKNNSEVNKKSLILAFRIIVLDELKRINIQGV